MGLLRNWLLSLLNPFCSSLGASWAIIVCQPLLHTSRTTATKAPGGSLRPHTFCPRIFTISAGGCCHIAADAPLLLSCSSSWLASQTSRNPKTPSLPSPLLPALHVFFFFCSEARSSFGRSCSWSPAPAVPQEGEITGTHKAIAVSSSPFTKCRP